MTGFRGGSRAAVQALQSFLRVRLKGYAKNRNKPELHGTSQLSPYLHFGHIGPHTVALAVRSSAVPSLDRKAFLEELIVRRELAVNFVRFNADYEKFDSCEPWADLTLRLHIRDPRPSLYTESQLENAETHDPLWNAAQKQMVLTGWMHGYLRMYWAKKILEWSATPREAYEIAVRLNDRYELDAGIPADTRESLGRFAANMIVPGVPSGRCLGKCALCLMRAHPESLTVARISRTSKLWRRIVPAEIPLWRGADLLRPRSRKCSPACGA